MCERKSKELRVDVIILILWMLLLWIKLLGNTGSLRDRHAIILWLFLILPYFTHGWSSSQLLTNCRTLHKQCKHNISKLIKPSLHQIVPQLALLCLTTRHSINFPINDSEPSVQCSPSWVTTSSDGHERVKNEYIVFVSRNVCRKSISDQN